MKTIFLSYTPQDSETALALTNALRDRGIDVFFDYERMLNQVRFTRRMAKEIEKRDCLLLLQSPSAFVSEQVQAEVHHAQRHGIDIVPVLLEPVRITDTSEFAYLLHTSPVDFTDWHRDNDNTYLIDVLEELLWDEGPGTVISVDNAHNLQEFCVIDGHTSWVRETKFSPDGQLMASCSNDNTVRLWDVRARDFRDAPPRELAAIEAHTASVWGIAFSITGNLLASCSNDNMVRIWNVEDPTQPYEFTRFTDHHEPVYDVRFSPNRRYLASASHDNTVHLRDIAHVDHSGLADSIVPLPHSSHAYSVDFSPNSRLLASASRDSTIRVWQIDPAVDLRKQQWNKPEILIGHSSWVNTVTFSPVGDVLASTSHDTTIRLWETNVMKTFAVLTGHAEAVNMVSFSPNGRLLVSCSKDNTVRVWDIATQEELCCLYAHNKWVNSAYFSPDGTLLATASGDNTIKFWGIST